MKSSILKEEALGELLEKEKSLRKELFNLRFQAATGHIENPNRFKEVRREIGRVLTFVRMKKDEADV